jgi:hypothetical protein
MAENFGTLVALNSELAFATTSLLTSGAYFQITCRFCNLFNLAGRMAVIASCGFVNGMLAGVNSITIISFKFAILFTWVWVVGFWVFG